MIRWAQPVFLWLLLLVPAGVVGLVVANLLRRRRLGRAIDAGLVARLTPDRSAALANLRGALALGALALFLVAAARPKWGEKLQLYKGKGIDVVICLDASKSMYAEDVKPSRLVRAKTELSSLIDGLAGNAVGIVAFAGEAYVMCPLTTDADAARLFLDIITPEGMPVPGTDFGRALDVALSLLNPKEPSYKAVIFVTDGDDLGKGTPAATQRAAESGVRVFPVAFATPEGAPIPEYDGGRLAGYKKDENGQVVMSRMNERELILMAQATDGRFLRVEGFSAERLLAELDRMRKKELGGGSYAELVERYQWFLLAGVILLVAALAISDRRGAWLIRGAKREE